MDNSTETHTGDLHKEILRLEAGVANLEKKLVGQREGTRKMMVDMQNSENGQMTRDNHNYMRLFQTIFDFGQEAWTGSMDKLEAVTASQSKMRDSGTRQLDELREKWKKTIDDYFIGSDCMNDDLGGWPGYRAYAKDVESAIEEVGLIDK